MRGEETEAAARTAAIFDEDEDEDELQRDDEEDGLPSFRKRDARDASEADDPDAAIIRKKKKKRHHSPDEPAPTRGGDEEREVEREEEEEDPYANMTEAESEFTTCLPTDSSSQNVSLTLPVARPSLHCSSTRTNRPHDRRSSTRWQEESSPQACGEDDLDLLADEEVAQLRREMVNAADDDEEANRLKKPATNKLKLLPKVVATLQKNHLQQSILDNNLLEGVKRWLEPLPDKSLPALNIQHQFFQILERMTIDTISLKMSGLGKVVVFYSMCSKVEPKIKRSAEHLIGKYSSSHRFDLSCTQDVIADLTIGYVASPC